MDKLRHKFYKKTLPQYNAYVRKFNESEIRIRNGTKRDIKQKITFFCILFLILGLIYIDFLAIFGNKNINIHKVFWIMIIISIFSNIIIFLLLCLIITGVRMLALKTQSE